MTKLVLAISNHGFMMGGGEHSFLELLCNLNDPWNPLALIPEKGDLAERLTERQIKAEIIPLPPLRPWFLRTMLCTVKAYINLCRDLKTRLIYANGPRAAFYGGIAGRISGIPVIFHCRVIDRDPFLDFILGMVCTRIVVNSTATANRFRWHFRTKVKVIYNGVNIKWLQNYRLGKLEQIKDDWRVILVVARVSRWKRHDIAISAFEQVAQFDSTLHLVCVGDVDLHDPEWWDQLQARTTVSQFSDRIHWVGQVNDIRPWYHVSSVLVLASENEPFGRVLVEAMACGVPVVATKSGGIPEIVRHGNEGLLVKPGRAGEMAEAIKKIIENESLRKRLSESAENRSHFFSIEKHVSNMQDFFEQTLTI